jgi:hypothetical protein
MSESKRTDANVWLLKDLLYKHLVWLSTKVGEGHDAGYPIRQQMQARAAIEHNMINSLDANDAAALRQWEGSAESFIAMLYDRCLRAHGGDDPACARYHE